MVVDRLRTDLLNKLINARIDLAAYLQLRKAKGYMSVSESDTLRDNFFELNRELHDHAYGRDCISIRKSGTRCAVPKARLQPPPFV